MGGGGMASKERSVAVIARRDLVRHGIVRVLEGAEGLRVAGGGAEATEGVPAGTDVVLLVSEANDQGIGEAVGCLVSAGTGRILVLAEGVAPGAVEEALGAGASGFLSLDVDTDRLVRAVRDVGDGGAVLAADAVTIMRARIAGASLAGVEGMAPLTVRQREILGLLGEGLQNKQIARRLSLTVWTVKTHLTRIFDRLGVSSRTEAAAAAYRYGLVA